MKHETWIKTYDYSKKIFIIIGLLFIIDGLFFIPFYKTKYGFNNIGLDMGLIFIGFSAYFLIMQRIHQLELNKG